MANGYIGKISAVVTANTSDLSRKLQGAVGDVDKFANRIAASIERSSKNAADSLNNIFTPLQRLQRNIQAGLAGNVFRRDNVQQYIRSVQQAVSISEQLGKPLASGASQFQKLSLEVQGAFLPALDRAQSAVINLSTTLQQQGSISERSFGQVEAVVARTTQAIQRLTQAQQLASQSLTGNELQFGNPRLFETLTANAAATRRAAALPATALEDGSIARQVRALQQYQNAAVEAAARVESLRLEPNVNPEVVLAAERRLIGLIETARRAGREVETSVANAQGLFTVTNARPESAGLGLFGTQAGTAEQRALSKARELSAEFAKLPESAQQGLSGLAGIAANLANRVDQGKASAEQLDAVLERLRKRVEEASPAAALARANARLTIAPDQPPPPPPRTDLGNRLQQAGANRIRGLTGDINIDSRLSLGPDGVQPSAQAQRDIDALASRVGQVRQQLEALPNSVRTQFIPALQQAQQQLIALQNAPGATADQIERVTARVRQLEEAADRTRQALAIPDSSRLLQGFSTRQAVGELEALSQILARIGAQAGGPAAQAYDRYAAAVRRAVATGTTGLPRVREELERLQAEAARAAAATGRINFNTALRQIRRGGDVARGAFGNAQLAIQQAVFAVDDFFSVTGDLSQRIRAAGNNISQLGFVLGGTTGLIAGVSIAITGQLVAALIRWANGGRTAEDQTKALNEALSKQKSTFDDLRQSIESLADSLADNVFSQINRDIRTFEESVARIENRLAEARSDRASAAGNFAGGGGLRGQAEQQRIERELQGVSDPVRAALLARQSLENRESLDRVRRSFAGRQTPAAGDLRQILSDAAAQRLGLAARDRNAAFRDRLALPQGVQLRRLQEGIADGGDLAARRQQLQSLRDAEGILAPIVEATQNDLRTRFFGGTRLGDVTAEFERLQQAIILLERDISAATDGQIVDSLRSIRTAGERLATDIGVLEQAVSQNVAGAAGELSAREALGQRLRDARDSLAAAAAIEEAEPRRQAVEAVTREIGAIEAAIEGRRQEIQSIASLSSSVSIFAATLDRISTQLANTVAQEARSAADQARRESNAAQAAFNRGPGDPASLEDAGFARIRQGEARVNAERAEAEAAQIRADNILRRLQFEQQAAAGRLGQRTQELIGRRDAAQAVLDDPQSAAGVRLQAEATLEIVNQALQAAFERSGLGRDAARQVDDFDQRQAAQAQREEDIRRGRELSRSPAEQAGRQIAEQLRQLEAFRDDRVNNAGVPAAQAQADFEADRRRLIDDSFRSTAPAIFALADSVANAVLQGPSRAALQATDVSSVEGARELNRLLRGDDAARDQNLVELQKQSQSLDELVRIAREGGADIAN